MASATCVPHTSYLATPEFMATALHTITAVDIPIVAYGGYCILLKTPKEMSSVKGLMLLLHVLTALSDLFISFVTIPLALFPAAAGYGLGFFDAPGLEFYIMVTFVNFVAATVVAVYENRYFVLFGWNTWWKHARKPFLSVVFLLAPLFFLPPYIDIPDQELGRHQVSLILPCLPPFTFNDRKMYVLSLDYVLPSACMAAVTLFYASILIVFFFIIFSKILMKKEMTVSARTQKMQRNFAVAFAIQSVFLFLSLLTPIVVILISIVVYYHNQAINNLMLIVFSFHGFGSTVVMMVVYKPYRDFTISLLHCSKEESKETRVTSIVL